MTDKQEIDERFHRIRAQGEIIRELMNCLIAIRDSAADGRNIPEWLQERMVSVNAAIAHAEGKPVSKADEVRRENARRAFYDAEYRPR